MKLKTRSLIFKSAAIFTLLTFLNITLFAFMVFENQIDLIIQNSVLNSQIIASRVQFRMEDSLAQSQILEEEDLYPWIEGEFVTILDSLDLQSFAVFDEDGRVLGHRGDFNTTGFASPREHQFIAQSITVRTFEGRPFSQHLQKDSDTIELYIPFFYGQDRIGVVLVHREMIDVPQQMGYLYRQIFLIALIVLLIHGGYAVFITFQIFKPLRELLRGARSISGGDLETRVPIVRDDEIGELSNAFNEMSVAIRNMHDEARGANPLTGLPGNISIAKEIDSRLEAGQIFAVLYCDLDNFKAYNDKYGFSRGDEAINFVKECMLKTKEKHEDAQLFLGHEGGDDFVLIADYEFWEPIAQNLVDRFDHGIQPFYSPQDYRNGFIESVNRQGRPMRFPLMSISIAVVSNKVRNFHHHGEIVQVAAEVKKLAKKKEGSYYVEDTRGQLGESRGLKQ